MSDFVLIRGSDLLHLGLSWSGFQLQEGAASPNGAPRLLATTPNARVTITFPAQILSEAAMISGDLLPLETHIGSPAVVVFAVPFGTAMELNPESVMSTLSGPGIQVLTGEIAGQQTTSLEIPWHLLITVAAQSTTSAVISDHQVQPITSPSGITGLWRARLRAVNGDDTDARLWLQPIEVMSDEGIRTPLTVANRSMIVANSRISFPHIRRLELTALGGSLSVSAKWSSEEWDHEVVMGRDQHVRTQVTGVLYPFGHQAILVTITNRKFPDDPGVPSVAALISTATLQIAEPVRPSLTRGFPFDEVEIIGRRFVVEPAPSSGQPDLVFVPSLNGGPFKFPIRCAGVKGDVRFGAPLVFLTSALADTSRATAMWEPISQIDFPGGIEIDLVRSSAPSEGDVHEVHGTKIFAKPDGAGSFVPILDSMTVALPALRALMCNAASEANTAVLSYTRQFLTQANIPDLALELATGIAVDFTDRPERSGGLIAPKFIADGISRVRGLVPTQALSPGAALSTIYQGATLLGLPLAEVLNVATPLGPPTIVPTISDPPGAKMTWANLPLKDTGPLKTNQSTTATLSVERSTNKSEVICTIQNFSLVVPPPPNKTLVELVFGSLTFTQIDNQSPDLKVDGFKILFEGELKLIQSLLDELMRLLPSVPAVHAALADPVAGSEPAGLTIDTTPSGLTASFAAGIDQVPAGMFVMRNIAAHLAVNIPFSRDPVTVSLGFASRDNPFSLSVLMFGGGGYVDVELGSVFRFEASLDFGASVSVNFVVVSAEVHALGGVHFLKNGDAVTFEAFIRLGGSLDLLGVVSVSVELVVSLAYDSTNNQLSGQATLVIDVDLTLFSESVTIDSGPWILAGSHGASSPMHLAPLEDGLTSLLEYYEAFAA